MFPARLITRPVIWELGKKFELITNVRQASVTDEIGIVCLELDGERAVVKAAIKWLESLGVKVEPVEIGGVEGGNTGAELEAGLVQAVRVARRDNHLSSLLPREAGRLEPDTGAAADHDDGLPEQVPLALRWR